MLDLLCNVPSEVEIGGIRVSVAALTLHDLARLQRFIRDHAPQPREVVEEVLPNHPDNEHARLRYDASRAEREFPPCVGTEEGTRVLLSSTEGILFFLDVMLRPHLDYFDDGILEDVMDVADENDFALLTEIAFEGVRKSEQAIRAEVKAKRQAPPPDFAKLYVDLVTKEPHWTFEAIAKLTLPQIAILANGGKAPTSAKASITAGQANQMVREAAAKADPNAPPPQVDAYRAWAEKSLGLKKPATPSPPGPRTPITGG